MKIYETRLVHVSDLSVDEPILSDDEGVARIAKAMTDDLPTERLLAIYLGGENQIAGVEILSKGGLHGTGVLPREVFQGALLHNASGVILAHNHPSGNPAPSVSDIEMTLQVAKAGEMLGVPLFDHVIVTRDNGHSSMLTLGILKQ